MILGKNGILGESADDASTGATAAAEVIPSFGID